MIGISGSTSWGLSSVSITRSTWARSFSSVVTEIRARISSRSASVRLPFSIWRSSERVTPFSTESAADRLRLRTMTRWPLAAATSVMPVPMIPDPKTPTLEIDMGAMLLGGTRPSPR